MIINSAAPASVYLSGVFVGLTGAQIETTCGPKYLRLGAPPEAGAAKPTIIKWVSEGKSINVVCKAVTTQTLEASK